MRVLGRLSAALVGIVEAHDSGGTDAQAASNGAPAQPGIVAEGTYFIGSCRGARASGPLGCVCRGSRLHLHIDAQMVTGRIGEVLAHAQVALRGGNGVLLLGSMVPPLLLRCTSGPLER